MGYIIQFIHVLSTVLILLVIVYAIISFFMSPSQPFRRTINSIVDPLLNPIRKLIPPIGGTLDLSPLIFVIAIQLLERLIISVLMPLAK